MKRIKLEPFTIYTESQDPVIEIEDSAQVFITGGGPVGQGHQIDGVVVTPLPPKASPARAKPARTRHLEEARAKREGAAGRAESAPDGADSAS